MVLVPIDVVNGTERERVWLKGTVCTVGSAAPELVVTVMFLTIEEVERDVARLEDAESVVVTTLPWAFVMVYT